MISEIIIQDLKSLNLIDIIGRYVKLKKRGSEYVGLCPFHDEKTPSFSVHPHKGYHCFGCGESGSNGIDFLIAIEKMDFPEAVERLAGMTGISIDDDVPYRKPTIKPIQHKEPEQVDYIDRGLLDKNLAAYKRNNLYQFFVGLFGEDMANELFNKYHVGSFADGATLFAQKDFNGNFRQVKKIMYKEDGHRDKSINPLIIGRQLTGSDNLRQCLFGEHLIKGNDLPVALVESEKTAAICSIVYPQYLWLATGGKNGCSMERPDVNKVLRGRRLYLFPDVDGVESWQKAKEDLTAQGFTVNLIDISKGYEAITGTKFDIADLIVSKLLKEPDLPRCFVDAMSILERYEKGEISGDEYLDLLQDNFEKSGLTGKEYVQQTNKLEPKYRVYLS